jgi:hypothetical protein
MGARFHLLRLLLVPSLIAVSILPTRAQAQEQSTAELAKAAQNPIANMMSFPFQNNTNFDLGGSGRNQNVLNIQPVLPFYNGRLITRTIIPLVWQPDMQSADGTSFGVGDMLFTAFYAPPSEGATWGIGPVVSIPTGKSGFGSEKWGLGPSAVALAMPGRWVLGALINNVWSIGGDGTTAKVNVMTLQPFINYNFPDFYFTFSPVITANWEASSGQQWTVPLGLGAGKLLRVGSKGPPINVNVSYYSNVVRPDNAANWTLRAMVVVLLPTSVL